MVKKTKNVKRETKGTVTAATEQEVGTEATEPEKTEKPKAKPKFTISSIFGYSTQNHPERSCVVACCISANVSGR